MTESYVTPVEEEYLRVSTADNKYTVIQIPDGSLRFLRNGVDWHAANDPHTGFRHANIIRSLAYDLLAAREQLKDVVERALQQTGIDFS